MATIYKILCHNGSFDHVERYGKALQRAAVMADAPGTTTETELRHAYGVTLTRLTPSEARAAGFNKRTK